MHNKILIQSVYRIVVYFEILLHSVVVHMAL